jgi:hypothetical protein
LIVDLPPSRFWVTKATMQNRSAIPSPSRALLQSSHPEQLSAGTRSDAGRECRDAFLGLAKTCAKHGVTFWNYLGDRLRVPGQHAAPPLPDLVRCRGQPA